MSSRHQTSHFDQQDSKMRSEKTDRIIAADQIGATGTRTDMASCKPVLAAARERRGRMMLYVQTCRAFGRKT
jgi:hypothetical protein